MLKRREDYAHQQPSLTKKKLRRLELTAGAPKYATTARDLEHQRRHAPDRTRTRSAGRGLLQAARPRPTSRGPRRERWARARHRSAHEIGPRTGQSRAADSKLLTSALRYVSYPRPPENLTRHDRG